MKPSEEFEIHILSDEEFNNLPYDNAQTSLGMSVMKTRRAYIRETGVRDLDMGTINHEFDEMMQKESPHEINGIRYKALAPLISSFISWLAPAAGSAAVSYGVGKGIDKIVGGGGSSSQAAPQQAASPVLSAFAPQGAQTSAPLSDAEFKTGLGNIDRNANLSQQSVFSKFRGLGTPEQNTAFGGALESARTSSTQTRDNFISDQEERKRAFA